MARTALTDGTSLSGLGNTLSGSFLSPLGTTLSAFLLPPFHHFLSATRRQTLRKLLLKNKISTIAVTKLFVNLMSSGFTEGGALSKSLQKYARLVLTCSEASKSAPVLQYLRHSARLH